MYDVCYLYEAPLPGGTVLYGELSAELGRVLPTATLLHCFLYTVVQRFTLKIIH